MKIHALLEGNQIHWLDVLPKLSSPIQVVVDIPDDLIIESTDMCED